MFLKMRLDQIIDLSIKSNTSSSLDCCQEMEDSGQSTSDNIDTDELCSVKSEFVDASFVSDNYFSVEATHLSSDEFDEDDNKPLTFVKALSDQEKKVKPIKSKKKITKTRPKLKLATRVDENGKTKFICDMCPKEFTDKSSRRRHRNVQHFGILFYCDICKKNYKSKTGHSTYHKILTTKIHQCTICNEVFVTYYALISHRKTHSVRKEYECNICGKKFAEKHLSVSHRRRVHDKERPHQCTYCPKSFFSSFSLKDHITTHTKERKYDCKECGMLFTTSTILKEHELRHSGIKEFGCTSCDKRFYRRKDLKRHELVHSKTYEHQCSYCGLKFRRKDHLRTHERGVHNLLNTTAKVQAKP